MLDLEALVGDMHGLAAQVVASAKETHKQRDLAAEQLAKVADASSEIRKAVQDFGQDMALPAADRDVRRVYPPPDECDYTVIATDGSQIEPDFHHVAPWYLINAGFAILRYGAPEGRERCVLASRAELKPPRKSSPSPGGVAATEEGRPENADARAAAVGPGPGVQVERLKAELALAADLLTREGDPGRTVLLLDGPLIQWRMLNDLRGAERREVVSLFRDLIDRSRNMAIPVAGFISRSRAVEWVTLLRFSLCPTVWQSGRLCPACGKSLLGRNTRPPAGAHHAPLAGLRDIELAGRLFTGAVPGSRTEVIELQSSTWTEVSENDGAVGFFYLQTGPEVARVELPQWVWENDPAMELVHAALWDQCRGGNGYPMVLSEAHEAAVVRAPERAAFYALIERILDEYDLPEVTSSAKAQSKRRPLA